MTNPTAIDTDLTEFWRRLQRVIGANLFVSLPARVVSYDPARRTASLQPTILLRSVVGDEEPTHEPLQPLYNVPVQFPGNAKVHLTFALEPGDTGILVFQDRQIDGWLTTASDSTPRTARTHAEMDAVFIPGVQPFSNTGTAETETDALTLTAPTKLKLGGTASTRGVAYADTVSARLSALESAFNQHVHALVSPPPPATIPLITANPTIPLVPSTAPIGSDKVLME